jgi:hypothetical protein
MGRDLCVVYKYEIVGSLLVTYVTTRIEKKVAKELLAAFNVPAREVSTVSTS